MTRKELIEQAFQKIATGDEEQRFLAIRLFKKALEIKELPQIIDSELIELYILLTEINCEINLSKEKILNFTLDRVILEYGYNNGKINATKAKASNNLLYYNSMVRNLDFGHPLKEFFKENLPSIWIKAIKYDLLSTQYQEWKSKLESENIKASQLDKFFDSANNNLLE